LKLKVYGVTVSYYTGKLEAYLRYKGIDYDMEPPYSRASMIREKVGAIQIPIVERDDGRWMSDSTPIILQLEKEFTAPSILPEDPVVRFIAYLIEDYADEWLWRAAMHYRWSYEHDRALLSRILVDEVTQHVRSPRWLKLRMIAKRQRTGFVINDGVTASTRDHVEAGYLNALENMTQLLRHRPFLLGTGPSIADIGMMGPMLRHFGQDPTPAEIMRNKAPYAFDWLSRVWNARETVSIPAFVNKIPEEMSPFLKEIAETHLAQLAHNAIAYRDKEAHFEMTVQGCHYRNLPVSRYRVHCLEVLRERYAELDDSKKHAVKELLPYPEAKVVWENVPAAESGYDIEKMAPYNKAINVYGDGVPGP